MVSVKRKSFKSLKEKVPDMDPVSSDDDGSDNEVSSDSDGQEDIEDDEADVAINDTSTMALNELVDILSKPEDLVHSLLFPPQNASDQNIHEDQVKKLRSISKTLFSRMEKMAHLQEEITKKAKRGFDSDKDAEDVDGTAEEQDMCPLSGLSNLYTGEENDDIDNGDGDISTNVDAETVWGQVDLQNESLFARLRKNMRKLEKKIEKESSDEIRLINLGEDSDGERSDVESEDDNDDDNSKGEVEDDNESEDEDARRIRERMEKTMANMEEEDDDNDESSEEEEKSKKTNKSSKVRKTVEEQNEEDLPDPAAEDLNDGFFDLHDMEEFADEEEEMLPDEAYGQTNEDDAGDDTVKEKKLPHLKARAGDEDSDNDDDEYDELEKKISSKNTIRRRRYRDDEDVDALLSLYENIDEEEQSDEDDVVNMTSADFFGKPNKKYWNDGENKKGKNQAQNIPGKSESNKNKKSTSKNNGSDDDSWDDYNFEDGPDWRDKASKKGDGDSSDEDEEDKEESGDENESSSEDDGADEGKSNQEDNNQETNKDPSNFKKHAQKLEKVTEEMESEILGAKPWQMVGESKGTERPTNSLLEKTPEFEVASKMAPLVTAEFTADIEDIIKKRILEEDWDDVIPRELPDIGMNKKNGELPEVSQEKSKLGLGELYEREYLKKVTGYDKDAEEKQSEEDKLKSEMKGIFANLCSKLDALSNYHFAPRPVADEADVKALTTPAIAMEEVLPTFVSDARAVAPEEVYQQKKGRDAVIRAESEMDQTDRKRLRQAKKAARRKKRQGKLADEKLISKLQPGLGLDNPYEKRKMREELQMARASGKVTTGETDVHKDYTTSAKFFERMQTDVHQSVQGDDDGRKNKKQRTLQDGQNSGSFKL
eukprot:CAMPEP_0197824310 /NCGR_PEP_ID=MMETSP1437-20131217/1570_1 /TAXON_ID=49252 ORGANISM="Eucampia antarctica, Strain CCMP1452" /NCGR_SAMPLE_ID=MMETSP1437 /ASSEMBLY_ACC=CAM_ASM_001096 /LENGTH=881 /DNA_ID=CAMNT_0043423883 /DNA_START=38 /DNA_END=2683 /DNA_ORIENTATION=-